MVCRVTMCLLPSGSIFQWHPLEGGDSLHHSIRGRDRGKPLPSGENGQRTRIKNVTPPAG
jgi:hypothetical protein